MECFLIVVIGTKVILKMKENDKRIFALLNKENPVIEGPRGCIQYKGTDLCINLHCECGHHAHLDGMGVHGWECSECGRKYLLPTNIKLIPVPIFIKEEDFNFAIDTES